MNKVLIVVDMQNDFVNGDLGTLSAQNIVPDIVEKVKEYGVNGDSVIFTRDTHGEDYFNTQEGKFLPVLHCIKDTLGWEIIPALTAAIPFCPDYTIIDKESFGFNGWGFLAALDSNVDEIELCGVCTDICVVSNALLLKALYPEVLITVNSNLCAGVTPEKHRAALETMRSCQINVL